MRLLVDGEAVDPARLMTYKGAMYSDVPNFFYGHGFSNVPWTLKCELTARYVCRLLNHMQRLRYSSCVPRLTDQTIMQEPFVYLASGYVKRALAILPSRARNGRGRSTRITCVTCLRCASASSRMGRSPSPNAHRGEARQHVSADAAHVYAARHRNAE